MAACPHCHQEIKIEDKHFGTIFHCPDCRGVFFVDWSGQPEIVEHQADVNSVSQPQGEELTSDPVSQHHTEPSPEFTPEQSTEIPAEQFLESPLPPEQFLPTENFETVSTEVHPENYEDVVEFVNTTDPKGPLVYHVFIKGIELAATSERVREALADSKFGWDIDEVIGSIQNGELILKSLTPVQASLVVSRLRSLPIELKWKQEVYSDSNS